jgi:hypothetical protein
MGDPPLASLDRQRLAEENAIHRTRNHEGAIGKW